MEGKFYKLPLDHPLQREFIILPVSPQTLQLRLVSFSSPLQSVIITLPLHSSHYLLRLFQASLPKHNHAEGLI